MDTKTFAMCIIGKHVNNCYKKFSECRNCNRARGLKRYYENKDKISNQQKFSYEKDGEKYFYRKKTINVYKLEI